MKLHFKILICILISISLGGLIGASSSSSITDWYPSIIKPSWNPPNWIFGPVWSALYICIGMAFAIIWHCEEHPKKKAYRLFAIQFILNLAWTPIFFNFHQIGFAFIEIIFMLLFIILTIREFYKINRIAAYLLVPYAIWVSFATVLNGTIYYLNR
jgi:translocator protein